MLNPAIHKVKLIQILKDIYSNTALSPYLGFKGGTAAYLFYDLSRFSVDLDFDLLDETKTDFVFEQIHQILKGHGKIKDARQKRYSLFFLISYQDQSHTVKIEINRREFGSRYELKTYLGISMLVMVPADMLAHKLMAMIERMGKTNRDIYDVWFFLKNNWPLNYEIVEQRSALPFKELLQKCIQALEKMSDHKILNGIGELLDLEQKKWAKTELRKDTIFLLKLRLMLDSK